ncbi:kynureninase [Sphingomonas sp.]|uniref:kynureninase n=1 Tax=Sphingomonas sp. TaxID=28214 RepID=UPI000DB235E5|nr:kynureninase [Sphingomonas sp.]PZU11040.1 MAG: kynureninase [Sphingomonas sp.]
MTDVPNLAGLRALDRADSLGGFRDRFALPTGVIYLDGNSLGALPAATNARMADVIGREWGNDLIKSWNINGWYEAPLRIGDKIGRLIGAAAGQVAAADSTSINIYKALDAALQLRPDRAVVLSEPGNFPNDLYIVQGIAAQHGRNIEMRLRDAADIVEAIDESVAVVMLTHVHYRTANRHDMAAITRRAHEKGALVIWDLCHSAGAIEIDLDGVNVDFAIGCGYKYLNGGPGCPAYIYVAKRHQDRVVSPLSGWLSHARPFDFVDDYRPADGIARFLCGAHPVPGLMALEVGVDLMIEAEMARVETKAHRMCDLFVQLVETRCAGHGLTLVTPRDAADRGSHISFAHPDGYAMIQALIERGVIGDYRAPSVLRFGFTPLYLSYEDVWNAVTILADILDSGSWREERFRTMAAVT